MPAGKVSVCKSDGPLGRDRPQGAVVFQGHMCAEGKAR